MAKAMGLIFSLFNVASAQKVPFGKLQYVQCILYELTRALLSFHSFLLTVKSVDLVVACDGFLCMYQKSSVFFIVATLTTELLFKQFLIYTAV